MQAAGRDRARCAGRADRAAGAPSVAVEGGLAAGRVGEPAGTAAGRVVGTEAGLAGIAAGSCLAAWLADLLAGLPEDMLAAPVAADRSVEVVAADGR